MAADVTPTQLHKISDVDDGNRPRCLRMSTASSSRAC